MSRKYCDRHDEIEKLCLISETFSEVERAMGLSTPNGSLRKYIKHHQILMPCFQGQRAGNKLAVSGRVRITLADLKQGVLLSTGRVKILLFREGLKFPACEMCGWCEMRNGDDRIPVHLHHKNGDTSDWRIENLQILCPNHHALTENYCGCNNLNPGRVMARKLENICEVCNSACSGLYCSQSCAHFSQRKVEHPTKEQLAQDIANLSWVRIGKKYGVSDKAIRKWARKYELI